MNMNTEHYPHKLAAIYPDSDSTEVAKYNLRYAGLGDVRFVHLHADSAHVDRAIEPEQAETRNHFIRDILIGGVIGSAVGAAGAGALALDMPSLFVSAPVIGPLMVAGYSATLGATAGAIKGFKIKEGLLAGMVQDAIRNGFHVLIVHSPDDAIHMRAERAVARTLVEDTLSA